MVPVLAKAEVPARPRVSASSVFFTMCNLLMDSARRRKHETMPLLHCNVGSEVLRSCVVSRVGSLGREGGEGI
ncbi:hypothetical protein D3C76_1725510 [compost metagenome]